MRLWVAQVSTTGLGGIVLCTPVMWVFFAYRSSPKYSHTSETKNSTNDDGSTESNVHESSTNSDTARYDMGHPVPMTFSSSIAMRVQIPGPSRRGCLRFSGGLGLVGAWESFGPAASRYRGSRLTEFRSRCGPGFQSIAQVSGTYGYAEAQTIVENCDNTLIPKCSASENGGTARFAAKLIGEREYTREHVSESRGAGLFSRAQAPRAQALLLRLLLAYKKICLILGGLPQARRSYTGDAIQSGLP